MKERESANFIKTLQNLLRGFGTRFIEDIRAGVKHWHDAKKDNWFSHLAVECPGAKCHNELCEPAEDDLYRNL